MSAAKQQRTWNSPGILSTHQDASVFFVARPCAREFPDKPWCAADSVPVTLIKDTYSDGRPYLYYGCKNCGQPCSSSVRQTTEAIECAESRTSLRPAQGRFSQAQAQAAREGLHKWEGKYHAYLQSDTWHTRRRSYLAKHPFCEHCPEAATLVHHKRYDAVDFVGSEPDEHLMALCERCHKLVHSTNPYEFQVRTNGWRPFF